MFRRENTVLKYLRILDNNGTTHLPQPKRQQSLYVVCLKSNESDFFCAAQKGQERKVGVKADGGGTQVYSLTFLS
jgi:hypothetical protein